jgi:hypothetical protein
MKPIKFSGVSEEDLPRLTEWIAVDQWHNGQPPLWWICPESVITARLDDEEGPAMYIRINRDGERVRLSTQFAPESIVSKKRVAIAVSDAFPRIAEVMRHQDATGIIFSSESPLLITFMERMGFKSVGNDDFLFEF